MGLDAGFVLKKNGVEVELGYFRKYHVLDRWIRSNCEEIVEDYTFNVDADLLGKLRNEIESFAKVLHTLPEELVAHFDDDGYEKDRVGEAFYYSRNEFNPTESADSFAGFKLLKLYDMIPTLIHVLEDADASMEYYSSY